MSVAILKTIKNNSTLGTRNYNVTNTLKVLYLTMGVSYVSSLIGHTVIGPTNHVRYSPFHLMRVQFNPICFADNFLH